MSLSAAVIAERAISAPWSIVPADFRSSVVAIDSCPCFRLLVRVENAQPEGRQRVKMPSEHPGDRWYVDRLAIRR